MARIISLVVMIVILLAIAALFFKVMADFLLPLFLAVLLVVMFGPLHSWFQNRCRGHERIAAALTTISILLMVFAPLSFLLIEAGYEAQGVYEAAHHAAVAKPADDGQPPSKIAARSDAMSDITALVDKGIKQLVQFGKRFGLMFNSGEMEESIRKDMQDFLAPLALRTTQFLGGTLVSLAVMILAVYYFFADGPLMLRAILRLSPLDRNRTQELLDQFDSITRAVVVATLLSAFVQGLLAALGFYVAGVGSVFLLALLCMLLSLVPFVGSAIVWVPVCLWLYAVEGRTLAAVLLASYCIAVVSMVDNVVKPMVLHGRSNLHPLLALLSVLGGVQVLGPIGILVGPMVVAFLQTLLNMVHAELSSMGVDGRDLSREASGPVRQAGISSPTT